MSTETLYQRSSSYFAYLNGNSFTTAQEFVDYVFSLVPGTGGIIHGDLEITGNLLVDGFSTFASEIHDATLAAVVTADFNSRLLYDSLGDISIDYGGGVLYDVAGGRAALDWYNRLMQDTSGATSIDWDARNLVNSAQMPIVDWENAVINDTNSVLSIDADARTLNNSAGNMVFSYENGIGYTASGTAVLDLNNSALKHGTTTLFDWAHVILYSQSGNPSIDADNRILYRSNGTTKAYDYQNGIINISQTTYADNAAALAGGLIAGDVYAQTGTYSLFMVH